MKRIVSIILVLVMILSIDSASVFASSIQADSLVNIAKGEVGTKETGENCVKYNNYNGQPWCAYFVSWCAKKAGLSAIIPFFTACHSGYKTILPNAGGTKHKSKSRGGTYSPKKGDIIFFYHLGDAGTQYYDEIHHVGIVYKADSTYVYYYDGNNSNCVGDAKKKLSDHQIYGYITPAYKDELPSTPTISSVSATGDNQIEIKWKAVSGATSYILQGRKAGGEYADIKKTSETSYVHKNLDGGSLYWYRVKAKNSAGTSGNSSASAAYTKPHTPTTVVTGSTNTIKVNWSSSGGASNYELLARKSGDDEYITIAENINGYTYTHTGLEAGTQYYYKIKAHNTEHPSIVSMRSDSGTGYTKLKAPVITSKGSQNVSFSWDGFKGNGEYTYTYRIRRCIAGAASYSNIATISGKSYTDSGLNPNTTYRYYIDVLRNGTYIICSETVDVKTNIQLPTGISVSPGSLTLTEGDTYALSVGVSPANSTDKSVVWKSDNTNVASVSENGVITARSKGTANISATTINGYTKSCTLTVKSLEEICTHSYGNWIIDTEATCTEAGNQHRTCTICNKMEVVNITAKGHSYSEEWIVTKEASCTEYGERKHFCTVCGIADEMTKERMEPEEHIVNNEWITDKEATCSENGIKSQRCDVCNAICNSVEIPVTEHDFNNEWTTEQEATCQQTGVESRICANCSEKEYHYLDKTDHDYIVTESKLATKTDEGYASYKCNYCGDTYTDVIPIITIEASIAAGSIKAVKGQTIDVEICIYDNPGIASAKIKINYDESVLTLKNVTDAGVLGSISHSPSFANPYTLYWNNGSVTENFDYNGTIVTLTFEVNSNAEKGVYPIVIEFDEDDIFNVDLESVKLDSSDGEVEIIDVILGDLNSDGKVSVKDNMILSRYIAEWPGYTADTLNVSAADLNCDNKVNVKDDMILARHIAEWIGYEVLPYTNK